MVAYRNKKGLQGTPDFGERQKVEPQCGPQQEIKSVVVYAANVFYM